MLTYCKIKENKSNRQKKELADPANIDEADKSNQQTYDSFINTNPRERNSSETGTTFKTSNKKTSNFEIF